jgi:hypothetical protein
LTDADRQRIRKRYKKLPAQQSDLIAWYKEENSRQLNQSQISKILFSQYEYLDGLDRNKDKSRLDTKRTSTGDWPELEGVLFEWQQHMQKKQAVITGEIPRNQASKLWDCILQYDSKNP